MATELTTIDSVIKRLETGGVPVQRIRVKQSHQMFTLTVKELRACCEKNPNHPHSAIFKNAIAGHLDGDDITVDRVDLEAMLMNKTVNVLETTETETIAGAPQVVRTEMKVLGQDISPKESQTDE